MDVAQATARALDPQARVRCAASAATAAYHLDLLTASGNNQWSVSRGPGAAHQVLLEEMSDLTGARLIATRPGRKRQRRAGPADLVILVGQDPVYAPPVRRLRLLGIPTWLLVPGHQVDRRAVRVCLRRVVPRPRPSRSDHQRPADPPPQLAAPSFREIDHEFPGTPTVHRPLRQPAGSHSEMGASRRAARRRPGRLHPRTHPRRDARSPSSSPRPPPPTSRRRCCPPTSCRRCGPRASGKTPATAYVVAPGASQPDTFSLTPHLPNGQVDYGPTRNYGPGRQHLRGPAGGRARSRPGPVRPARARSPQRSRPPRRRPR